MEITVDILEEKFEEYKKLGGSLDQVPFNLLEVEARSNIDKYTSGRLKELETQNENVQICMYKLIEVLASYDSYETQNKGISSENIDGYSVAYGGVGNANAIVQAKKNEVYKIISSFLESCTLEDGTPYLYRGVRW